MAYDDPGVLHLDAMLTNISVGYRNLDFVGDILFPPVRVAKQTDKYYVFQREGWTVMDDRWAPKSRANEMPPMAIARESYYAEEHALVDWVTPQEIDAADSPLMPFTAATERIVDTLEMNKEDAIQTLARATANYATGHSTTLSGTAQWSDVNNSTPIADIKTGRDVILAAIGRRPNVLVGGYVGLATLEDHPDFIERIKYSQMGVTTDQIIAQVMDVPRIVRATASKNTAAAGQAFAQGYMWGDDVVLAYVPPSPGQREPAYGYEFRWSYDYPGANGSPTERWWDIDHNAWKVRSRRAYDLKHIAVDSNGDSIAGYLIKDVKA